MVPYPSPPHNPLKTNDLFRCMGSFRRIRPAPPPPSPRTPLERRSGAHFSLRTEQWIPDQRFWRCPGRREGNALQAPVHGLVSPENAHARPGGRFLSSVTCPLSPGLPAEGRLAKSRGLPQAAVRRNERGGERPWRGAIGQDMSQGLP
jgi:hypothetical protein